MVAAMHLPAVDAPPSYFDPVSDLECLIAMVEKAVPRVLVLTVIMEEHSIPVPP